MLAADGHGSIRDCPGVRTNMTTLVRQESTCQTNLMYNAESTNNLRLTKKTER